MLNRLINTRDYLRYIDTENLKLFTSEENLLTLLGDYVQPKIEQARKEGYQKAQKDFAEMVEKTLKSEINGYIKLVTGIADNTYNKINDIFKESLLIIETRAKFSFGTHRINLLLVVEGDHDKEIEFAKFLQNVETEVFDKDSFFCEILYVNKRGVELNATSVAIDFPLVRNRTKAETKNAQ